MWGVLAEHERQLPHISLPPCRYTRVDPMRLRLKNCIILINYLATLKVHKQKVMHYGCLTPNSLDPFYIELKTIMQEILIYSIWIFERIWQGELSFI